MEINGKIFDAKFSKRINRFLAEVKLGCGKTMVHVRNPAKLSELLTSGTEVLIREGNVNMNDSLKTKHSLFAVRYKGIMVGIDSRMPNYIFESSLRANSLKEFSQWTISRKEIRYNDSRIDYLLENGNTETNSNMS